jgi:5-(aminomethyl)-3-furanmethanol phosphate kinase
MKRSTLRVVKLGGSLYRSAQLRAWLTSFFGGELVIVPGGGPFADQVRTAQKRWGFDEATGHRMAMLGMAQYGFMLAGLQPALAPAVDELEIARALDAGRVPVWTPGGGWLPSKVPRSWSVTSDSLALLLASRLAAHQLILVKSVRLPATRMAAAELSRRGVIDNAFPDLLARARVDCRILHAGQHDQLAAALGGDTKAGVEVAPGEPD